MRNRKLRDTLILRFGHVPIARKGLTRRIIFYFCIHLTVLSFIFAVYAATRLSFYYYNPDSVQSNFSLLTRGFGDFLQQAGFDASFQAFAQKSDFDRIIKNKKPDLVLVPSWYYQQYGESLGLTPLLASLENGEPNYKKILLVRKANPFSISDLQGRTVAMTTMGPKTEEMLNKHYFKEQGVDFSAMNIIITPKDADALYALALGQVDAALVGQTTLKTVGDVNQRLVNVTQEILKSSPVPTPLLCSIQGTMDDNELAKVEEIFLNGNNSNKRPRYMEILHINGWKKIL